MNKPFFSIVIPTYNRAADLKIAINSILKQDFDDYEIVVSDNASTDNTETICQNFKDKKLKYLKNKKNIGFTRNFYKVIKQAKGRYIFTLSDDDFLLRSVTLTNIYKIIQKHHYGYIRQKFIYHKSLKRIFSLYLNNHSRTYINKNQSALEIYSFIEESIYNFISGLVFLNLKHITIPKIEKNVSAKFDMSDFWIKFLFEPTKLHGGYIDHKNIIIAKWPEYKNPHFYDMVNNKMPFEAIWELYFENLNNQEKDTLIKNKTTNIVFMFISIKYYSNNINLIKYAKRLLKINPKLYFFPMFYIFFVAALIMPKFLWRLITKRYHHSRNIKDKNIINDFELLKSRLSI